MAVDAHAERIIGGTCRCQLRHVPKPNATQIHHVLPLSWGGTATSPDTMGPGKNTVEVCPTTHYNTHDLLNQYVHHGDTPPLAVLKTFNTYTRDLAAFAWANRIAGHPTPYW